MKKQISILLLLCATFFSACETTVTMDESVGTRVDAVMKGYIKELSEAENGWIAEVMTSEGYYRFHMDFTDQNMVTMYTDNTYYTELKDKPKTSTYNIRSLQRPTLSFDTYSYLAIINDPDNNISQGLGNKGLKTDFEFEIDNYTNGVFTLTGRVNRVAATLRKATAAEEPLVKNGDLMNVLLNTTGYNADKFCYFMIGSTKVSVSLNSRSISISYVSSAGTVSEASSYTHTELTNNIKLVEPFTVEGKTVTDFTWKAPNFNALVDGVPTAVEAQDAPVIPLYKMLGPDLRYTQVASLPSMYPTMLETENLFGFHYQQAINAIKAGYNMNLTQLDLDFFLNKTGAPRMTMRYLVGSFKGWVTYYLEYNEEKDQFKITNVTLEDDAYGNGAAFANTYAPLYQFWLGKTIRVDWSPIAFGSYSMAKVEVVGEATPGVFYGALF